jgi:uncharacterized protein
MDREIDLVVARTGLPRGGVAGCVRLLSEGNTIPFIARYRKEATGSLDETGIRRVEEALGEINALTARQKTIMAAVEKLGKLTPDLRARIEACFDREALEDLYLPYKQRKSTRADKAREAGLEPLAEMVLGVRPAPGGDRVAVARPFVAPAKGIATADDALAGARDIVADRISTDPDVRADVRDLALRAAGVVSKKKRGAGPDADAFKDWFDYGEAVRTIPAHRFLAVRRGEAAGALSVSVDVDAVRGMDLAGRRFGPRVPRIFRDDFDAALKDGWDRLLWPAIEREVLALVEERAFRQSVRVFEDNLRGLLMSPPVRGRRVLAVDPGFRNGCKCAAVDATGRVLATVTVYPHEPQRDSAGAARALATLVGRHAIDLVAVGDGTASRETIAFLGGVEWPRPVAIEPVREAGASVYSASELAVEELPDLDVTLRGAVSIARRLQDPLAELVKIDPKSIGVGQYQHDVDQGMLSAGLDAVVEECVNRVGVDANTASPALLAHVAGLGPAVAKAVVARRDRKGPFRRRADLLEVAGIGPARFTQCAGFLRIPGGDEPLDATGIHPERYDLVRRMAATAGRPVPALIGDCAAVEGLRKAAWDVPGVGRETLDDLFRELATPGRDPRGEFEAVAFAEGVRTIDDLAVGMVLEGRVTNVTDFGAFVDIGVHKDGLVHVSRMADRPVRSPMDVVRPQVRVRVKVIEVDKARGRISLSMRPSDL